MKLFRIYSRCCDK